MDKRVRATSETAITANLNSHLSRLSKSFCLPFYCNPATLWGEVLKNPCTSVWGKELIGRKPWPRSAARSSVRMMEDWGARPTTSIRCDGLKTCTSRARKYVI